MGVADLYKTEESKSSSLFLKGTDFDGEGQTLVVVGMEKFTPENTDFGVKNTYGPGGVVTKENWFVKEGVLEEGQSFKYRFTQNGENKEFDNNSVSFFFAFRNLNPEPGQEITIKRTKKSNTDVDWDLK